VIFQMMNKQIHMSIAPLVAFWRPLGLLTLAITAVVGFADLAAYGELIAPREPLGRALILITSIEALWNILRTVYDAWPGMDEIATSLVVNAGEMALRYTGQASVLVGVTALARGTEGSALGPYVMLVNLVVFVAVGVIEIALIAVHWRGVQGATVWFQRILDIIESRGKDLDAVVGKQPESQ
jgi:hypothetical protein